MDSAVDQTIARSTTEQGAGRAAQLRRQQQAERTRLQKDITTAQTNISKLNDEAAPIRAEVRKVEAEVGPIKYIAKLIYGDSADNNLLEKAVTWVIITIIFVFDPLAILMILASQMSYQWWREDKLKKLQQYPKEEPITKKVEESDNAVTNNFHDTAHRSSERVEPGLVRPIAIVDEPVQSSNENNGFDEIKKEDPVEQWNEMIEAAEKAVLEEQDVDIDSLEEISTSEKLAMKRWKEEVPGANIHRQRTLLERGMIAELPWLTYIENDLKAKADDIDPSPKKKLT
jgi:hypothetical protein